MTADLVIAAVVVVAAVTGWRRGGSRTAGWLAGLLVGGVAGHRVAPWVIDHLPAVPVSRGVGTVVVAVLAALLGGALGGAVGARCGTALRRWHLGVLDRVVGAGLRAAVAVGLCWVAAAALTAAAPGTGLATALRHSTVLSGVTGTLGTPASVVDRLPGLLV